MVDDEMRALKKIASCLGGSNQFAIDVGANWGIYSNALSKSFEKVFCVEPNPACVQYLKAVLGKNCQIFQAAASNKDEYKNLRIPVSDNTAETTRGTISERNTFDGMEIHAIQEERVHCIKLDEAVGTLPNAGRIALIKVDVEGHELEAIEGAEEILKRHRPVLFVELEQRHGTLTTELRDLTARYGYKTYLFSDPKTDAAGPTPSVDGGAVNVIFLADSAEQTEGQKRLRQYLRPLA